MTVHLTMSSTFCKFFLTLFLLNAATFAIKITPCKVRNMVTQPNFGINAKNNELVNVLQIPPLLTQSVQIAVCLDNNRTFIDYSLPNMPHYICRQRYSVAEVYSKRMNEKNKPPLKNVFGNAWNKAGKEDSDQRGFAKEFIIIEAGCDFSFNFLPLLDLVDTSKRGDDITGEQLVNPETVGMNFLSNGSKRPRPNIQTPEVVSVATKATLETSVIKSKIEYKTSSLSHRSVLHDDYFRSGLHLNATQENIARKTHNHDVPRPVVLEDSARHSEEVKPLQQPKAENSNPATQNPAGYEELPLRPEDIGLPILIFESSIDPVMRIISNTRMN